jgi:hypothetical protein
MSRLPPAAAWQRSSQQPQLSPAAGRGGHQAEGASQRGRLQAAPSCVMPAKPSHTTVLPPHSNSYCWLCRIQKSFVLQGTQRHFADACQIVIMASFASIQPRAEGARSRPADARPGTLLNTDADGECAVTFASWNIRKLTTHTKDPEGWLQRKLHILSSLRALAPDFIAIQEVCSGEHGKVIFPPHKTASGPRIVLFLII